MRLAGFLTRKLSIKKKKTDRSQETNILEEKNCGTNLKPQFLARLIAKGTNAT